MITIHWLVLLYLGGSLFSAGNTVPAVTRQIGEVKRMGALIAIVFIDVFLWPVGVPAFWLSRWFNPDATQACVRRGQEIVFGWQIDPERPGEARDPTDPSSLYFAVEELHGSGLSPLVIASYLTLSLLSMLRLAGVQDLRRVAHEAVDRIADDLDRAERKQ